MGAEAVHGAWVAASLDYRACNRQHGLGIGVDELADCGVAFREPRAVVEELASGEERGWVDGVGVWQIGHEVRVEGAVVRVLEAQRVWVGEAVAHVGHVESALFDAP